MCHLLHSALNLFWYIKSPTSLNSSNGKIIWWSSVKLQLTSAVRFLKLLFKQKDKYTINIYIKYLTAKCLFLRFPSWNIPKIVQRAESD